MKRVEGIIQPHRLAKVVKALHTLPEFPGFTLFETHGQGHGRGAGGQFIYEPSEGLLYHRHLALVVICSEELAPSVAQTIAQAAHTGNAGDGIVILSDVNVTIRIRDTGNRS